jgi:hypothetical protein
LLILNQIWAGTLSSCTKKPELDKQSFLLIFQILTEGAIRCHEVADPIQPGSIPGSPGNKTTDFVMVDGTGLSLSPAGASSN